MSKIKVAIFHLAFVYSGGGEKLVLKEAHYLSKKGYDVKVFTSCVDRKKCFPDLVNKVHIEEFLPWTKIFFANHEAFRVILSSLLAPFFAYKFKSFDIIFAANQPSLWIAYIVKILYRKKYIGYLAQPTRFLYPRKIDKETGLFFTKSETESFSVKLMKIFKTIIKKLDDLSVKNADTLLINGPYMTDVVNKIYKVKGFSCPAGADYLKTKLTKRVKEDERVVLMTNRHAWQKRFEYGITAFFALLSQKPNSKLIISGKQTEYTKDLKNMVNRLGFSDKVVFTGLVNSDQLKSLYKKADIYLYTAPEEDFGMGIIEAMGNGLPVVAWNSCGPSKIILDGVNGFLVRKGDITAFTEKLLYLANNPKVAGSMGQKSIERVKEEFSWDRHLKYLESSINNLLD